MMLPVPRWGCSSSGAAAGGAAAEEEAAAAKYREVTGHAWGTDDLAVAESIFAALKSKRSEEP